MVTHIQTLIWIFGGLALLTGAIPSPAKAESVSKRGALAITFHQRTPATARKTRFYKGKNDRGDLVVHNMGKRKGRLNRRIARKRTVNEVMDPVVAQRLHQEIMDEMNKEKKETASLPK